MISILIIGDEILSAQIEDSNLKVMLRDLNAAHYHIDEVRIVPDDIEIIADALRQLSARSEFVISTGGVGPTHDDITFEAYAVAFESPLHLHPDLDVKIRKFFGDNVKDSMLRMARIPERSELVDMGPKSWPIVKVANCFVLPGLPEVFLKKFERVKEVLPKVPDRFFAELFTSADETEFAAELTQIQKDYAEVAIGSYPTWDRSEYAAHITLKCTNRGMIDAVYSRLEQLFHTAGTFVKANPPRIAGSPKET